MPENYTFNAKFFRRSPVRGLYRATIRQKFSNHTLLFLDYKIGDKASYVMPPEKTPVQILWGKGPTGVRTSYGYVNHYETVPDASEQAVTRMVLIGTSLPMNSSTPKSWEGTTRSAVARDIAVQHRLRSVIHDHPYVMEHWATGNRTDFQALKALADEAGYRLWVDGSTLYFLDPTKVLRSASTLSSPLVRRQEILKPKVLGGSNIPGVLDEAQRRVQYGLDYRTNEFFVATSGDPLQPSALVTDSANTYAEAQYLSDASSRKQNDYYALTATIRGNALLYPGATMRVDPGSVNTDQGGLWGITEAEHEIDVSNFTTKVVATRGLNMQPLSRIPTPVRGASEFTPAVIRDGLTWEAQLQEHLHV